MKTEKAVRSLLKAAREDRDGLQAELKAARASVFAKQCEAVAEFAAGTQDGLVKRFASDKVVDDVIGRALSERDACVRRPLEIEISQLKSERDAARMRGFEAAVGLATAQPKIDAALAERDELRRLLEDVLPYAAMFWRSGEQPASCIAEAADALAKVRTP